MKLTTGILAVAMMTGASWAQNPNVINNVQNKDDAAAEAAPISQRCARGDRPCPRQPAKPGCGRSGASGETSADSGRETGAAAAAPAKRCPGGGFDHEQSWSE